MNDTKQYQLCGIPASAPTTSSDSVFEDTTTMCAFSPTRHINRAPEVAKLLEILRDLNVQYVLVGSVAASVYGAAVNPGDLDIVPELQPENLDRLVEALRDVEAVPHGPFGNWTLLDTGEWKWIPEPTTDKELGEWTPDVRDVHSFDNLFLTRLGNFDVVPEVAGPYETLRRRAILRSCYGCDIYVAHVDDLLARLTVPRREKDRDRVAALRQIQRQQAVK